jgi:DNA modification methylase
MNYQLHQGHNAEVLKQYPDSHFDVIITDPPYGIEFLGKDWDNHTGTVETWQQCLRVLKPGGHLLAFSAARTYHHLATNIESVGFEIRDQLMWIYSSGFPKAQDIGKSIDKRGQKNNWHGWKTALKPGHEPIVMARRPFKGSTIDNVLQHGVGALNIDVSRIPFDGPDTRSGGADGLSRLEFGEREPAKYKDQKKDNLEGMRRYTGSDKNTFSRINPEDRDHKDGKRVIRAGRDPRNRLKDLESQTTPADHNHEETPVYEANPQGRYPSNVLGDIPDYQKYFYCPKVSRRERHAGFEQDHIPKRLTPMPGANGLKDIYDCYDKENQTDAHAKSKKLDPLAHIPVLSNYSQGDVKNHPLWDPSIGTNLQRLKHKILEHNKDLGKKFNPLTDSAPKGSRRCSTDSHERWHQGMEHKKGDKADPLAHIPTNPSGMYDVDGTGVMYNPNKKDSLAHLPTESSMLAAVGGYFIDEAGNRTDQQSKNIWTPETGMVYVHGLTKIYAAWCQNNNKTSAVGNNHPTVKPVALMRYLIQLVTPANSRVLDPFMGSGSTGMAAVELGHRFVGIDLDANYVSIADRRIQGWCAKNPIETKTETESPMVAVTKPNSAFDRLFE